MKSNRVRFIFPGLDMFFRQPQSSKQPPSNSSHLMELLYTKEINFGGQKWLER